MNRRKTTGFKIALIGIALAILLGGLAFTFFRPPDPEPSYQGKPLSDWLDAAAYASATSSARSDARIAVRAIGTNALPHLLKLIEAPFSENDGPALQWMKERTWISERGREKWGDQSARRFKQAAEGFNALGNLAAPAIPQLIRLAARHDSTLPVDALTAMGPVAVAPLIRALTNNAVDGGGAKPMKLGALYALQRLNYPEAAPNLLFCLDDSSEEIRMKSIEALALIKPPQPAVVARLIQALDDPKLVISGSAARALGGFGAAASNAVPVLLRMQTNGPTRGELFEAVAKITRSK